MSDKDAEIAELKAKLAALTDPPMAQIPSEIHKTMSNRQKAVNGGLAIVGVLSLAIVALSMCSGGEATKPSNQAMAPAPSEIAEAPAAPPSPTHRWNYQDGSEYGYQGTLSDDDKKAGKAASEVHMFRYLGEKDGVFTVESASDGNRVQASCANPCEVVKIRTITPYGNSVEHVSFAPDSIVGAALSDAFDGQLQVRRRAPRADGDGQ